jgi:hypothetical protein
MREDHADRDQQQDHRAADAQRHFRQVQRGQEVAAEEHEDQQQHKGDRAFADHDARAARRRHRIEDAGKQRHVAERVGHQQQQDKVWKNPGSWNP